MRNELGGVTDGNITPELNDPNQHDSSEDLDDKMSGVEDANHNIPEDKHVIEKNNSNVLIGKKEVRSPSE